ncbi:MAG TPA: hypothetical protein VF989_14450 [Polyangiaceae bacterium]|jgi:hypothetical protein
MALETRSHVRPPELERCSSAALRDRGTSIYFRWGRFCRRLAVSELAGAELDPAGVEAAGAVASPAGALDTEPVGEDASPGAVELAVALGFGAELVAFFGAGVGAAKAGGGS